MGARPALTPIVPGVRRFACRTATLPPATHTNCWVLGDDEVVLIDPGSPWEDEQNALAAAVSHLHVSAVVLTHHHNDHAAGVDAACERIGAPLWAHADTASRISRPVDRLLQHNEVLDVGPHRWQAFLTPGHADGHLCFFRPADGSLVAGDMVAGVGTILLDPPEGHLATYISSLERLVSLKPSALFPAHGPVIRPALPLLNAYIAHRHQRSAQVRAALRREQPRTAAAIVPHVYPDLPEPFHPFACRQVLAHLRWLIEHGDAAEGPPSQFVLLESS